MCIWILLLGNFSTFLAGTPFITFRELFKQETTSGQDLGAVSIQEIVREAVRKKLRVLKKAS